MQHAVRGLHACRPEGAVVCLQEPRDVIEVMARQTDMLFAAIVRDERLLRCVRTWLGLGSPHHSSQNVGAQFIHVLLHFLADEQISALEQPKSKVITSLLLAPASIQHPARAAAMSCCKPC